MAEKTVACPRCAHANLEEARFCNSCAARMDGRPEDVIPTPDAFAHQDPLLSFPAQTQPMSLPESPRRPPQSGKMGQLAAFEEPAPTASYASVSAVSAPEPVPAVASVPVWKRPTLLAAFASAAVVAASLAYVTLRKKVPTTVDELPSSSRMPMPEPVPAAPLDSTPPETSSPAIPAPRAPKAKTKSKGKRTAKADKASQDDRDPLLEALLADATLPASGAAAESAADKAAPSIDRSPATKPGQFSLPGLQRPVSASDRSPAPHTRAPLPPNEEVSPAQIAGPPSPLAVPGKPTPTPGIEDGPDKSTEGAQLALVEVHEQFDFCAQLLVQGAYGDHYDTCLCQDTRKAAPLLGRRSFYVTAKKKEAGDGLLGTTAKILSSTIDGGVAKVTARWKSGGAGKGRDLSQTWKLENGLWCQAR